MRSRWDQTKLRHIQGGYCKMLLRVWLFSFYYFLLLSPALFFHQEPRDQKMKWSRGLSSQITVLKICFQFQIQSSKCKEPSRNEGSFSPNTRSSFLKFFLTDVKTKKVFKIRTRVLVLLFFTQYKNRSNIENILQGFFIIASNWYAEEENLG